MAWNPALEVEVPRPYGWKAHVNDVVHSFCYAIRNPWPTPQAYWRWPFILLGNWPKYPTNHGPFDEPVRNHRNFLKYIAQAGKGTAQEAWSDWNALLTITYCWTAKEYNYANYLLEKYYGVQA